MKLHSPPKAPFLYIALALILTGFMLSALAFGLLQPPTLGLLVAAVLLILIYTALLRAPTKAFVDVSATANSPDSRRRRSTRSAGSAFVAMFHTLGKMVEAGKRWTTMTVTWANSAVRDTGRTMAQSS